MQMWNGGWMVGGLMWIIWILVIVAIIFVVTWFIRQPRPPVKGEGGESALEILRKRYARGEIDRDEFERRKKDLQS